MPGLCEKHQYDYKGVDPDSALAIYEWECRNCGNHFWQIRWTFKMCITGQAPTPYILGNGDWTWGHEDFKKELKEAEDRAKRKGVREALLRTNWVY
jgi:hypothetical protein